MNESLTGEVKQLLANAMEELREERDELNLKMHLASAEIRDEWEDVEKKWKQFVDRAHKVESAAKDSSHDVAAAAVLLGEELKKSFARVKKML